MVTQQFFLPMVPDSAPIVVNISQYDFDAAGYAGRLFFNLVNEGAAYDMDGASAIFQGEKPDGTTFAYAANVVNASVVRVNVRQQMTTVAGRVVCSLIVSNQDGQVGSFNIWLEVQPSSAAGGDPSQTDIPALIAQAKEYADAAEQAAEDAETWSAHPPYIGANGNWFVYDTATTTFVDTGVYAAGTEGNLWYSGTAISGKDPTPAVYPTGIATARQGDMYLNKSEGAIYQCTLGGADTVAKWAYQMTLTGGGGGGTDDYNDLNNRPKINSVTLTGDKSAHDLGLQSELTEGNGINIDPVTLELSVDLLAGSNVTLTPKNGAIEISATGGGGGGGDTVSWTQIQTSTGATKIAEIDINGTSTDVYAPSGGGSNYNMLDNSTIISGIKGAITEGTTNDDVVSGYGVGVWSNTDTITLLTPVSQGDDTVGTWEDDATWESGSRAYWLKHTALHGILSDDDVEISLVFDVADGEAISCLAYRIDDAISSSLGGIAIKFNAPVQNASGATVGVILKRSRTNKEIVPRTS